ncbi:MAG: peptidase MA domain-containing protein [Dehalococcoidia bacterium]|nr:MAG: peptidase MA domain-containing protein [Dehalococcoidia bacterium]
MIRKTLIILFLFMILLVPASASADSDIKLVSSTTKIDFPNLLTFNIEAESSAPITRIRLLYQVDKVTYAPSFAESWPNFQPGNKVSSSWSWDMRKGSLPPGAHITYWWIIQDSSGNKLTTTKETLQFDDTRHKWQKVSDKMINIFWYEGSKSFADQLLKAAVDAMSRQEADTGVKLDKPVSIYIYANYRDLRGSIVAAEEWTGGVAYAGYNIISIGISTGNLDWGKVAVAHEIGHLITHQVTDSPYGSNIPPWLDEGLAMHAEGTQGDSDKEALKKAIEAGTIATLQSLSSPFSADAHEASYAYAQSQSVIEYLTSKFDKNKIHDLLIQLNDGSTMDDALMKIYGFDLDGLDQAWMDWLMGSPVKNTGSETSFIPNFNELFASPAFTLTAG